VDGGGEGGRGAAGDRAAHLLTSGGSLCALFRRAAMPAIADDDMVTGVAPPLYAAHAPKQRLNQPTCLLVVDSVCPQGGAVQVAAYPQPLRGYMQRRARKR